MKIFSVFRKGLHEQLRELWLVALIWSLAPFFVLLYWLVFGGGGFSTYKVVAINRDTGAALPDGKSYRAGDELLQALKDAKDARGQHPLIVLPAADRAQAEDLLLHGKAHVLLELDRDLSASIVAAQTGAAEPRSTLTYSGDMTSTGYLIAAALLMTHAQTYLAAVTGTSGPIDYIEKGLGGSEGRSDFDMALPGLFVFAVILLIFPTAMALARESDGGTLRRLQLTRMTAFDLLGGISLVQMLIGVIAVVLAFLTAVMLGFESRGPVWVAILIACVCSLSVVGVGLLVACFSRTVTEAFIIGNFPMMLLMFFSGAMMPIPKVPLFSVGSVTVGLWDVLPTTHAVSAVNKILGVGVGLDAVVYELVSLVVLSAAFFIVGVVLFRRRRLVASD